MSDEHTQRYVIDRRRIVFRFGALILGLVAAFVAAVFLFAVLGIVITGIAVAFFLYNIIRYLAGQLSSSVTITPDGVYGTTGQAEDVYFNWEEITHAGKVRDNKGKETIYLYAEDDDRLLKIPDEFARFPDLSDVLARHVDLQEDELGSGSGSTAESIEDLLKQRMGLT